LADRTPLHLSFEHPTARSGTAAIIVAFGAASLYNEWVGGEMRAQVFYILVQTDPEFDDDLGLFSFIRGGAHVVAELTDFIFCATHGVPHSEEADAVARV
jgi:hypothetical protein